jgi:oxygen-dependent protoporphyrinogen oxidase
MVNRRRVVVVGAGIAGLTAAYRLQQAGAEVSVYEARDYVGGRMASAEWEGFIINPGAQFFTGVDRYLLKMAEDLGLGGQIRRRASEGFMLAIYRDGRIHPVNFLSIGSYLRWSGVSLAARLAMFRLLPHILRFRGLDLYHMECGPTADDVSCEQFFRRSVSQEMFDYWAYPTFETNCSYQADDLSRKAFLALMAGYLNASTYYFEGGVGALTAAFGRMLDVQLSRPVRRIELEPGAVSITVEHGGGSDTIRADRVVVAVPGTRVLALFEAPRPAWRRFFPHVAYTAIATQFHVFEHPAFEPGVSPADGVMIPRPNRDIGVAFVYFQQRQGNRWLVLTEPRAGAYDPSLLDAVQLDRAWQEVCKVYPDLEGRRVAARQFRWPEKVPAFRAGYLEAVGAFFADPQENPVYFCGDYLAGPGTGAALFTGWECADRVLAGL